MNTLSASKHPASKEPLDTQSIRDLLQAAARGDAAARNRLAELYYAQFHELASHISTGSETIRPTVLVNDLFLKLMTRGDFTVKDRRHFHLLAGTIMRNQCRDHYRRIQSRGGNPVPVEDWHLIVPPHGAAPLAVFECLEKLEAVDPLQALVIDLRVFAGCTISETAEALSITDDQVNYAFKRARAFLRTCLEPPRGPATR